MALISAGASVCVDTPLSEPLHALLSKQHLNGSEKRNEQSEFVMHALWLLQCWRKSKLRTKQH